MRIGFFERKTIARNIGIRNRGEKPVFGKVVPVEEKKEEVIVEEKKAPKRKRVTAELENISVNAEIDIENNNE